MRALMTRKSCAVQMRNAILGNHLKSTGLLIMVFCCWNHNLYLNGWSFTDKLNILRKSTIVLSFPCFIVSKLRSQLLNYDLMSFDDTLHTWRLQFQLSHKLYNQTRGGQQRFVNMQTQMLPGDPPALFVKPTKRRFLTIDQSKSSRV